MFDVMRRIVFASIALAIAASAPALSSEVGYKALKKKAKFEEVEFDLKDAIVNRGLVIDYEGFLGKMLSRTEQAVSGGAAAKSPYRKAKYFQFCSAKLTHDVVSANPLNISICPYVVFIFELESEPGTIHVGYRRPFAGPSAATRKAVDKVEALLLAIVTEAAK